MWRFLTLFSEWLLKGSVQSALKGAGLGIGTAAVSLTIVNTYINKVIAQSSSFSTDMLALAALSGAHISLSMIFGAIVWKLTSGSAKLSLIRKS